MSCKEFITKTILPIVAVVLLFFLLRPLCMDQGTLDWRKWLLFAGIPFGVGKMFFWILPRGTGIGETVGILVLNLLIGGMIGSIIMGWKLLLAVIALVKGVFYGIRFVTGK